MKAAYIPWAAELLLECAGAWFNLKRSKLLSAILIFCAISDIALFFLFGRAVYAWASWAQMALKGLLLIWLGCSICGMFVRERDPIQARLAAGFISVASMSLVMSAFFAADALKDRLLDAEIVTNFILFGLIALGWLGRKYHLTRECKWIAAGFLLMVGSDLAVTLLWLVWEGARHWYPLGTIAAQLTWIAGPLMCSYKVSAKRRGSKFTLQVEDVREAVRM